MPYNQDILRRLLSLSCVGLIGVSVVGCQGTDDGRNIHTVNIRDTRLTLEIGSENTPQYALSRVGDIGLGPNGNIYVLQLISSEIRVFGPNGDHIKTLGRSGAGPGEFVSPAGVGWIADTLWVFDAGLRRVTHFGPDGDVLRTVSMNGITVGELGVRLVAAIPLQKGKYLGITLQSSGTAARGIVTSRPLVILNEGGEVTDTLAILDVERHDELLVPRDNGAIRGTQFFRDHPIVRTSQGGKEILIVKRRVGSDVDANVFTMLKLDSQGDTLLHRAIPFTPVEVTDRFVDSLVHRRIRRSTVLQRTDESAYRQAMWVPPVHPPVKMARLGIDGTIWIHPSPETINSRNRWDAYGSDGEYLFSVDLPVRTRPFRLSQNQIVGVRTDTLDVPHVVRFTIE